MEYLKCKACGCYSMVPMNVEYEDLASEEQELFEDKSDFEEQELRFYNCNVCGDNWLSIKEVELSGACHITFIHQMGATPVLKRVAHMETKIVLNQQTVDSWEYFSDDDNIGETDWKKQLKHRRKILKSICTN